MGRKFEYEKLCTFIKRLYNNTEQKTKFSVKDFFNNCEKTLRNPVFFTCVITSCQNTSKVDPNISIGFFTVVPSFCAHCAAQAVFSKRKRRETGALIQLIQQTISLNYEINVT